MDTTTVGVDLAKNVCVAYVANFIGRIVEQREFNLLDFLTWLSTLPTRIAIGMESCDSTQRGDRTASRAGAGAGTVCAWRG